jgi:hypothetical protein
MRPDHEKSVRAGASSWWARAAVGALALFVGGRIAGAADALTEPQVKAAFIFNFAKFVQWPAQAFATSQAPIVLCVPAREGLGGALAGIDGKQVHGRELRVRRGVKPDDMKACHILFVPDAEARSVADLLRTVGMLPVLTIGEPDGFAAAGGGIGFVTRDERVQFEINQGAVERANLQVSSQLLRLATIVQDARRSRP